MTLEEIDRGLKDRLEFGHQIIQVYLTEVIEALLSRIVATEYYIDQNVKDIVAFLDDDMRSTMTGIVSAFASPEALVAFLVNAPPGQEAATLDMMQELITMTFERGL